MKTTRTSLRTVDEELEGSLPVSMLSVSPAVFRSSHLPTQQIRYLHLHLHRVAPALVLAPPVQLWAEEAMEEDTAENLEENRNLPTLTMDDQAVPVKAAPIRNLPSISRKTLVATAMPT
jgi:hypothetical protein